MRKLYLSAPLPFVGQKRMFAKEFINVLEKYPDDTVFIDLFGGSGLLSHIAKVKKPDAKVIYNDFDNYRKRLDNISATNALLRDLRKLTTNARRHTRLDKDTRDRIIARLEREEKKNGYVDYITISSSILFSMKYKTDLKGIKTQTLYNNVRLTDYDNASDYLDGLTIENCDYKRLFNKYKDIQNAVFLVDPPYLNTEVGTYTMSWNLADYLDVLSVLKGHSYVYFTSNKSNIIELCKWISDNKDVGNPFKDCTKVEFNARMNYNSTYTDVMLYNNVDRTDGTLIANKH